MANDRDKISLDLLHRQLDRIQASLNAEDDVLSAAQRVAELPMPDINEKIGRLDGAIEGLRHSQHLTVISVLGAGAILIAIGVYTLQRIDSLYDRVNAIPGEISSEMRDLTKTLADVIIATKQASPSPLPSPTLPLPPPAPIPNQKP